LAIRALLDVAAAWWPRLYPRRHPAAVLDIGRRLISQRFRRRYPQGVGQHGGQWCRHLGQRQGLHEQKTVADLASRPGSEKSVEVIGHGPATMRRLLLQSPERHQVAFGVQYRQHAIDTDSPDQLVLQITVTAMKAERCQTW
jgi:hypothetical protein